MVRLLGKSIKRTKHKNLGGLKMKHRNLIFCFIAVMALGLMGYGYAAWSATVTIGAPVNTGSFALGIAAPGAAGALGVGTGTTDELGTKDLTWGSDTPGSAGITPSAYDVGSLTDANGTTQATNFVDTYWTNVTETYANVYPDYQAGYTVDIKNGGTIPIQLQTPVTPWGTPASAIGAGTVASDYFVYSWTLTDNSPATDATTLLPAVPVGLGTLASGACTPTASASMSAINGVVLPAGHMATLTVNAYFNDNPDTNSSAVPLAPGANDTQTISILGNQFNH
jgi:hypothetical protein